MTTTGLFNAGILTLPLATATTIMFFSPILVTVLSIFVLGELVGVRRWIGICVGCIGAVIVVEPWTMFGTGGLGAIGVGTLFMLAAALTNASYQIVTRLVRGDDALTSLLFTAAAGAVVASCIVPWYWQWPDAFGWLMLVASGVAGAIGHLCLIQAFRSAPASVVAPYSYSSLIWATAFGFLIWRDVPGINVWIGAALIVAAGLYIFIRERQRPGLTESAVTASPE